MDDPVYEELIKNLQKLYENICLLEKIVQSNTFVSVEITDIISVINKLYTEITRIDFILDDMLHTHLCQKMAQSLPKETLKSIVLSCLRLLNIVDITSQVWHRKKIKGDFKLYFQEMQKMIKENLNLLLSAVSNEEALLVQAELEKMGINIKFSSLAEDYEIEDQVGYEHSLKFERSTTREDPAKKFAITGNISVWDFEETKTDMSVNFGLPNYWLSVRQDQSNCLENKSTNLESEITYDVIIPSQFKSKGDSSSSTRRERSSDKSKYVVNPKRALLPLSRGKSSSKSSTKVKVHLTEEQKRLINQMCKEALRDVQSNEGINEVSEYQSVDELQSAEPDKSKYQLLARLTKGIQSNCLHIMKRIKSDADAARGETVERQMFKFVFLVDNSGSMNGDKMTMALNILIILLETLKRMEYETAVVRFGGEESQVTLKSFQNVMDSSRGQFIIEAFNASEKTLAADAVKYVAEKEELFGCSRMKSEHRFIMLITDGIWAQQDKADYTNHLYKADARLMILTTHPRKDKDLELYNMSVRRAKSILDNIAPGACIDFDGDKDLAALMEDIARMIDAHLRDILSTVQHKATYQFAEVKHVAIPSTLNISQHLKCKYVGSIDWGPSDFTYVSNPLTDFKFLHPNDDFMEAFNKVADNLLRNDSPVDGDRINDAITQRARIVDNEEEALSDMISQLDNVVDLVAFPNNRPTRTMEDYHGPTFSLRGFIKFICTDGQYKKIYENMIGHPRKDYLVSVILDTSVSMAGMSAVGASQAYISLASVLQRNGIEFNLLTVGSSVSVVKEFDQEWDYESKARAYEAIDFTETSSMLSDAIMHTIRLYSTSKSSRGSKTMFILTDGYASAPYKLRMSVSHAESLDIQVIALGVGFFTDAIFRYFPNYIVVNNPKMLAKGLHRFYCGEGQNEVPNSELKYKVEQETSVKHEGQELTKLEQIWSKNMKEFYKNKVEEINKNALYMAINPIRKSCNSMSIDLCFVLDTTGSMGPYIEMAKKYIVKMTTDIKQNVMSQSGRTAILRVGFISYKIRGQAGNLQEQSFTENILEVQKMVQTLKASGGSSGGVEDKYEAIEKAMSLKWQSGVKFMVLIADWPGHGLWCTGPSLKKNDNYPERAGDMPGLVTQIAKAEIHMMYVSITNKTDYERKNFRDQYLKSAPKKMQKKGFLELDIKNNNDAKHLQGMITKEINQIICSEFL